MPLICSTLCSDSVRILFGCLSGAGSDAIQTLKRLKKLKRSLSILSSGRRSESTRTLLESLSIKTPLFGEKFRWAHSALLTRPTGSPTRAARSSNPVDSPRGSLGILWFDSQHCIGTFRLQTLDPKLFLIIISNYPAKSVRRAAPSVLRLSEPLRHLAHFLMRLSLSARHLHFKLKVCLNALVDAQHIRTLCTVDTRGIQTAESVCAEPEFRSSSG